MFIRFILSLIPFSLCLPSGHSQDWRTASRDSAGIAPLPEDEPAALVQIYGARAYRWRGYFAVHSWIATKQQHADHYKTYQVIGFRARHGGKAVVIRDDIPDRHWYGATPELYHTVRGDTATAIIPKIEEAVRTYPYQDFYRVWPGPNSNTFISYIIRRIPELTVELPPNAIGKDWIENGDVFGPSESGWGGQLSLFGLFGITLGLAEGVEVNVLGLTLGLDIVRPALKLPLIGRVGMADAPF